jgi:S1-C subfamily serine protease
MTEPPRRRLSRALAYLTVVAALALGLAACSVDSTTGAAATAASAQPAPTAPATAQAAPTAAPAAATAQPAAAAASAATAQPAASAAPSLGDFSTAIRNVVQHVKPAVVQITNEQLQVNGFTNQPFAVPAGVGSGVIYDDQGHILTNNHVVAGAQQLTVALPDGNTYPAELVGADPYTDLAVLKIDGKNLPVAQFGDSGALQVGDWVVAIGNALALPGGPTVSTGVVSALGRTVQEPGDTNSNANGPYLFDVVQTDAPINPGNSGGPLLDLQGKVIGINTLVAGQAEPGVQAQGIGFAISIASAKPIADQLVASGHAVHPYLGVEQIPLSPAIAVRLGTNLKQGVVIVGVGSGTPAAQAGLQARDIITAIDGTPIVDDSTFAKVINSHKPGDALALSVMRGKQAVQIQATLAERAPAG